MGLDVGEESIATFSTVIERAATIVWNGPVGVFEFEKFAVGSKTVLENIVIATEKGATSIIGMSQKMPYLMIIAGVKEYTVKPLITDSPKSGQPLYSGQIPCP